MDNRGNKGIFGKYIGPEKTKDETKNIILQIKPYIVKYKKEVILVTLLAIFGNFLGVITPYIIGKAINIIKPKMSVDDKNFFISIIIILGISYLVNSICTYKQNTTVNKVSQKIIYDMRKDIFEKLHKFPISFFDKNSHGNIMSIITNDIENISTSLASIVSDGVVSLMSITITVGIMLYISPLLTLIQGFLVFVAWLFLKRIINKSKIKMRERQSCLGKLSGYIEEIFIGISEVKLFVKEKDSEEKFEKLSLNYKENSIKAFFLGGFNYPSLNYIGNIGYSIIILLGATQIIKGKITVGELSSFIIYSRVFNRPLANIADMYSIFQSVLVSAERFFSLLGNKEEDDEGIKELDENNLKGKIEFKNVEFSYLDNQPVINNLSFTVKPESKVAIVGPTGQGKTTLVNLIMRFYELNKGKIFLDDVDIKNYSLEKTRKLFGMVLQDTWLFSGTIRENIAYGNPEIDEFQVVEAAKKACIHDFIMNLPYGYDTLINQEKINISEGQRQLLTIARVIAMKPKILILDEATSGIDTRTEMQLQKAMENILKERTSFIIAHRLSTIKNADIILVIKNGTIEEKGTHNELMNKKGYYYELYNKQFDN